MTATLISPKHAAAKIAEAFQGKHKCCLHVQEQRTFRNRWLCLGTIATSPVALGEDGDPTAEQASAAFEWRLPNADEIESELASLLDIKPTDNDHYKIARALDQIASISVRSGLLHPAFDPDAIEGMPFRRAVTVVSDTSGVLQGALDFVIRYLYPAARVKIPSIVQMEFTNLAERYFSIRRSNDRKVRRNESSRLLLVDELFDHLKSQGGQRSLLRLELLTNTEIERTYLLGDPLRSAFQPDSESGLRELNISLPIRAYADRLILEAARHHQVQSAPGHAVRLLTSDQGLARMALAEGMLPLYFSAVKRTDLFGARLTGKILNPFTGEVYNIPLVSVLWELATGFGTARLSWDDGSSMSISALGDNISWSPFHSFDDLLWFSTHSESVALSSGALSLPEERADRDIHENASERRVPRTFSFQRMNINSLLKLICALDDNQTLNTAQVAELLGVVSARSVDEYRRFLLSADLVDVDGASWTITPRARHLSAELRNENAFAFDDALSRSPSYADFRARVARSRIGHPIDVSGLSRSAVTYRTMGEIALICASVGKKIYATMVRPPPDRFAQIALNRFRELDRGQGLVATGRWLESLIEHEGIHPEIARRTLEQASETGFLRRFTEGSTAQTAFDNHVVHVLRTDDQGRPFAAAVHLYRGDYLIPGKASVSIRIEELS